MSHDRSGYEDTDLIVGGSDWCSSPGELACLICDHKSCGWCPDCSPLVPEWD